MNPVQVPKRTWGWTVAVLGIVILFSPLLLQLKGVPFYQQAEYSDLLISHLPNALFAHNALIEWRQIPLWNPTIYAGAPFVADPLSGMTYLPGWIAIAFPSVATFNLLLLVHVCWAGVGCYLLARESGLASTAGVIFALAFAGTPKMFAHLGLGHISLIFSVCWTPWLLLCTAATLKPLRENGSRMAILAGCVLGLIFLADPRWAIPSLLLASGFAVHRWLLLPVGQRGRRVQVVRQALIAALISIGIAAPLALPLWEYVQLSTRNTLPVEASNILALDWGHLLGLFHPILSQAEQVTYTGVTILVLASLGLVSRKRGTAFWGCVFILSIVLSLGSATPLYPLFLRFLPGAGFLRVPARMLFLTAMATAFLAGYGITWLHEIIEAKSTPGRARLAYLSLILLIVFINLGFLWMGMGNWPDHLVLVILALGIGILLEVAARGRIPATIMAYVAMVVIVIDLVWVHGMMIRVGSPDESFRDQAAEHLNLASSYGEVRVFSPSYAVPQLVAVQNKLELVDGVNPLQLSAYANYLQKATGFEEQGYSVTLPPYPDGDPRQAWPIDLDLDLLRQLNTAHVLSNYPMDSSDLKPAGTFVGVYQYEIDNPLPRAWVEHGDGRWTKAGLTDWSPNRIQVEAEGPGRLVLSEMAYPGWRVEVDDQQTGMETHNGLLRAVDLSAGVHQVEFSFYSTSVLMGGAIFGLTILIGILFGWKR